ncbi:MAG: hypothetical protein J7502_15880, partial [Flavisolibacter sp.]|nr:hypothetical protein [Flavisolibacter sp.]
MFSFHPGNQKGVSKFNDVLPYNLDFNNSQSMTRQLLGEPDKIGGGDVNIIFGKTPPWDKYLYTNYSLHIQFSEDLNSIDLVTIDSRG